MALSLKAMEYFSTALRCESIAKAASELNIAASAVSVAIDQVEDEFGLTLVLRRRSRGITPNVNGRLVAQRFERLLEDYKAVLLEGADLKQSLSGTLRIGYYAPIAPAFLPPIISSCMPDVEAVTLHLEECDNDVAQDGLLNGAYDAILFVSEGARPFIEFDPLIEAPAYCLLPKAHRLASRESVCMAEIAKEPLVVLNRPVAARYYQSLFEKYAQDISIAAYANSTEMVRSLVSAGRGCAVLNMQPLITTSYCGADLASVPISDPLPSLTLAVGFDKSRPRRLVQHFVDACHAHFNRIGPHQCVVTQ